MGVPQSKPEERVNHINRDLSSLRNSLRISKTNLTPEKRNSIVKNLIDQSAEVKSFTGKVKQKKIEETIKKIGDTMQEILGDDKNASEQNTVIVSELTKNRTTSSNSSTRSNKSVKSKKLTTNAEKQKRQSIPTLMDIEVKFYDLRSKILNAIESQDAHLLRFYEQTLKTIASDMEMIETVRGTPMDDLKDKLSKQLRNQYQKIVKALKEFKRNDNLQFLSKQTRKSKALQELGNIELHLAETESLMDKMAKDKNDVDFSTIRNSLVRINEQIRSVDCVDDEVKNKVVNLTQKFKEIVKNNETLMTKRDFDYNFAQSVSKLETLINTFNTNSDKIRLIENLDSLRQNVEKLEEFNETAKNKKKKLLDQINKHIREVRHYVRNSQQSIDGRAVQQIVEDSVELRKKVKSSDKEHTVIDQFYNYWNNVKNNFNINSYSNISLLRLNNILEEMQTSIMDIRENIADKCDLRNTLDKTHSQSLPKLTLNKHNSAFGSRQSLNDDNKILRTKVKMYHLSTPELLNTQKEFLDEQHENKRFSKIEEIKTQVYYIKEKINEHHNKNLLRDKLEHYLKSLSEYLKDTNKIVANNANIVAKEIHELIHVLYLADIKESVQIFAKRADAFHGNKFDKDFDEIRENLVRLQVTLENLSIPPQYEQLEKDKNEMLDAIFYYIQSLEDKVLYYHNNDENVKKIHNRLVKAKEQIKRFSGVHKGPLYNAIERDLNKILIDSECIEDKSLSTEITTDVEKNLKILEQKASLAQSFRGSKDYDTKSLPKMATTLNIKEDLNSIRTEIDKTRNNDENALKGLKSRLDLVNLELGQISARSNENLLKEKDIFTNEVETLRNVVEAKITLGQQPSLPMWTEPSGEIKKTDVTKEMEVISQKFEMIKQQVSKKRNFKYEDVSNNLQELLNKLDQFRLIRNTDLDLQKLKLFNEIVYFRDELKNNFSEEKTMGNVEKTLEQIENAINSNQLADFLKMTEDIQMIQKKLNSLKYNHSLRERKVSCMARSEELRHQIITLKDQSEKEKLLKIQEIKFTLREVENKLKTLRQDINVFVGVKTDNAFYELDETITRLVIELDRLEISDNTLRKRKIALLKELHQQGKFLEDKANQTDNLINLEQNLEKVSNKVKNFTGSNRDYQEIKVLMDELGKKIHSIRCNNDLVSRKNACVENFSVLFNKVLAMANSVSNPKKVLNEPVKIGDNKGMTSQVFNFLDKPFPNSVIRQIEKEINECKPKIEAFCDVQQSKEFQKIDDILTKCTMKLHSLETPRNSQLNNKKLELMQLIEDFSVLLEKKSEDTETVSQVEATLQSIGDQIKETLTDDVVERIDETLIQMQVKLGKIDNVNLKPRKDACMMSIILYMGQIKEFRQLVKATAV